MTAANSNMMPDDAGSIGVSSIAEARRCIVQAPDISTKPFKCFADLESSNDTAPTDSVPVPIKGQTRSLGRRTASEIYLREGFCIIACNLCCKSDRNGWGEIAMALR
jgi:hypothetical protein